MRNSFVVKSVLSTNQISRSPLNRSSSKNLWTFGKQTRFPRNSSYCDSFYKMPSSLRNQGRHIGYGSKHDFTKVLADSPGAKYNIDTVFEKNKSLSKGYSMNLPRQKLPHNGYIELGPLKNPSPNKYNNMKLNKGLEYSMRVKTKSLNKTMTIDSQTQTPGPGRYENPQALSPRGNYIITKYKGTGATKFNPRRSKRFLEINLGVPGPGTYNEINRISGEGFYPLSQSKGDGKRKFDKQRRIVLFESNSRRDFNPGPGSYRSPSQFGQYDGDQYNYSQLDCVGYPGRHQSNFTTSKHRLKKNHF